MNCVVVKEPLQKFPLMEPKSFQPAGLSVWIWGGWWGQCREHKVSTQVSGLLCTYHDAIRRECSVALFIKLLFLKLKTANCFIKY